MASAPCRRCLLQYRHLRLAIIVLVLFNDGAKLAGAITATKPPFICWPCARNWRRGGSPLVLLLSNHDRAPPLCRCCPCAAPLLVPPLRGAGIAPHSGAAHEELLALLAAVLATAPFWRNYALMSQLDGAEIGRCLFVELRQGTIASCGRRPGLHMPRTPQKQPAWHPQSRLRWPQTPRIL